MNEPTAINFADAFAAQVPEDLDFHEVVVAAPEVAMTREVRRASDYTLLRGEFGCYPLEFREEKCYHSPPRITVYRNGNYHVQFTGPRRIHEFRLWVYAAYNLEEST